MAHFEVAWALKIIGVSRSSAPRIDRRAHAVGTSAATATSAGADWRKRPGAVKQLPANTKGVPEQGSAMMVNQACMRDARHTLRRPRPTRWPPSAWLLLIVSRQRSSQLAKRSITTLPPTQAASRKARQPISRQNTTKAIPRDKGPRPGKSFT